MKVELNDVSKIQSISAAQFDEMATPTKTANGQMIITWSYGVSGTFFYTSSWANDGALFIFKITHYQITANRNTMGHSSNLRVEVDGSQKWTHDSPDNLRSDNVKHVYNAGGFVAANKFANVTFTFEPDLIVFPDPKLIKQEFFQY